MSRRSHHRGQRGNRPPRLEQAGQVPRPTTATEDALDQSPAVPVEVPQPVPVPAERFTPESGPVEAGRPWRSDARPGTGSAGSHPTGPSTTAAQLRRFIKSRAWVPMHELRRRFGINGAEDDVTPVATETGTIYVGLPPREGQLLGELLRGGDIGYELSVDPGCPIVIGVYPMRPVPRH